LRAWLLVALRDADVAWSPEEAIEYWAIGTAAVAFLVGALSPVLIVPALVVAIVGTLVALSFARTRRERAFAAGLPAALEQVASELRGGGTVVAAVDRLAEGSGAVSADLRRVRARTRLGLPLTEALSGWTVDHDASGVRAAAGSLSVAATMGGRAADAIDGLAASLRLRLDAIAEARSLSAQTRLSAVVVGAAPLGYLAFAALVDPRSVTALLDTGVGRVCLVVGLGLEALAAWWIRRIARSAA
jgi:tight adherence protein B